MAKARILVVDDEPDLVELIRFNLERDGYAVDAAATGEEAVARARKAAFDLIVLDVMLPGLDGFDVCRTLRSEPGTATVPILMLTARSDDADQVAGLELGADDYLPKPFRPRVLLARVKALVRRRSGPAAPEDGLVVGPLTLSRTRHEVRVDGAVVDLTASQFALLLFLAERPGWVFSRAQIIDAVKGTDYPVTDRSVDVQIVNLRRKLGPAGALVETVRGVGYRFRSEP